MTSKILFQFEGLRRSAAFICLLVSFIIHSVLSNYIIYATRLIILITSSLNCKNYLFEVSRIGISRENTSGNVNLH